MNNTLRLAALGIFCLSAPFVSAQNEPKTSDKSPPAGALKTDGEKVGYSIGVDIANNLKRQFEGMDVNMNSLVEGLSDGFKGKPKLSEDEMAAVINEFRGKMMEKMIADQQKQQQERAVEAPKNLEAGKKFLAENAKKPDVKTTSSGLQYIVQKEGDGPKPKASDRVSVHYRGTLIDGTEFDSSYSRGEPATFGVGEVISGWTEALQLMKVGSKYKLFIPPNLAYGEQGAGDAIPPNSTLVFEVELLKIEK